jgi:2-C-methyl-D-erythritol 4-phosphate cytidylyltransferase
MIMVPLHHEKAFRTAIDAAFPGTHIQLSAGGAERQQSVARGLDALPTDHGIVVIHDAARPFIDADTIREAINEARKHGAATVATPCVDTILQATKDQFLESTPDRSRLWACQTPQVFRIDLLREAHRRAAAEGRTYTDDATLVMAHGAPVRIVAGSPKNLKVTTPEDLRYAEFLLKESAS